MVSDYFITYGFAIIFIYVLLVVSYTLLGKSFLFFDGVKEGMTNKGDDLKEMKALGVGSDSGDYAKTIQNAKRTMTDMLNFPKYKNEYETIILAMDDYIDGVMMKTLLSVDPSNPMPALLLLGNLQKSKDALNTVLKYNDDNK